MPEVRGSLNESSRRDLTTDLTGHHDGDPLARRRPIGPSELVELVAESEESPV